MLYFGRFRLPDWVPSSKMQDRRFLVVLRLLFEPLAKRLSSGISSIVARYSRALFAEGDVGATVMASLKKT